MQITSFKEPGKRDIRALIGDRVPFMTSNLATMLEIQRKQGKLSLESIFSKNEELYKGVIFTDDSLKVTAIGSTGLMSVAALNTVCIKGEVIDLSGISLQIEDYNDQLTSFSLYATLEQEYYHTTVDDSPVPDLEETLSRCRVTISFKQVSGINYQGAVSWDSSYDISPADILLCQVTKTESGYSFEDKRFVSYPLTITERRHTNLINILDNLKYLDADGITERVFVTKEIPQIPSAVPYIGVSSKKINISMAESIQDKVILREAAISGEYSNTRALLSLQQIETFGNASTDFETDMSNLLGTCTSTDGIDTKILNDSGSHFTSGMAGKHVYNVKAKTRGLVLRYTSNSKVVTNIVFESGDGYIIPIGAGAVLVAEAWFNDKITYDEVIKLLTEQDLASFNDTINNSTQGLKAVRTAGAEEFRRIRTQYEKELSERFSDTSNELKYSVKVNWTEPTTQDGGNTLLTQDIVKYKVIWVKLTNSLTLAEIAQAEGNPKIDDSSIVSKILDIKESPVPEKRQTYNTSLRTITFETDASNLSVFYEARWNDIFMVYVTPITEYGISGVTKAKYVEVKSLILDNNVKIEDDVKIVALVGKQKSEIEFATYTRSIEDKQLEVSIALASVPSVTEVRRMLDRATALT